MMRAACMAVVLAWGSWGMAAASTGSVAVSAPAQNAQQLLAQVRQQLQSAPVVRGAFVQSKTLQGFKQPLQSSGRFVLAQGKGMVWQVQQPWASTLRITPDSLQSLQADGSTSFALQADQEPVLRTINAMLFAVMGADVQTLAQHFHVSGSAQPGKGWQLSLVPREAVLSSWLQKIELQGQQHVQQVRLQEARGDVSVISMTNVANAEVMSGDDAALFD